MKTTIAFTVMIMCCPVYSSAQVAISKALSYDTFIKKSNKEKGANQRLNYREDVIINGKAQTNVVFVYTKGKSFNIKAFIIKDDKPDSLIAYPEQPVINKNARRVYKNYFAKVFKYKKYPRYEYRGEVANNQSSVIPEEPDWVITAIQVETGKRALKAFFAKMNPNDYESEEASIVRKMNYDFDILHKATNEYATQNGIPIAP